MEQSSTTGKSAEQHEIWSFENLNHSISTGEEIDSGFSEVIEDAERMGKIDEKESAQLFRRYAKRIEKRNQSLETDRHVDPFTGLLNTVDPILDKFNKELDISIKENQFGLRAIMLVTLDLNDLKSINDLYGHEAGDQAILACADRLRAKTKVGKDFVFRIYKKGDEFSIVMRIEDNKDISEELLEEIFTDLESRINTDFYITIKKDKDGNSIDFKYPLIASMGNAVSRREDKSRKTMQELKREADTGMYKHKKGDLDFISTAPKRGKRPE